MTAPDHAALLSARTPSLAANKRLVYDFWREVFRGSHLELADKWAWPRPTSSTTPMVATGRAAFVEFFGRFKARPHHAPKVAAPAGDHHRRGRHRRCELCPMK